MLELYLMDGRNMLPEGISQTDFICGWAAACIETCVLFPVVKVTFRQQLHGVGVKEALAQVIHIIYNFFVTFKS